MVYDRKVTKSEGLHNLITSIQDRHITNADESQAPYVGLFYVVDGELFWEGIPIRYAEGSIRYKIYPKMHPTYWKDILKDHPEWKKYDAYYFPRGRVVYDKDIKKYDLVADKRITNDPAMVDKIISRMKLPKNNTIITNDNHYR